MIQKITLLLITLTFAISACGVNPNEPTNSEPSYPNTSYPNPTDSVSGTTIPAEYAPRSDDALLTRGEAYIDSRSVLTLESYPLQFMLSIQGSTPSPCHQLRVLVNPPDAELKILVEVYSVTDPNKVCAQVLSPFDVNIPLGSFPTGYYILLINGEQAAEFQA